MVEAIPGLLGDLDTDTTNVVLTLARTWMTLATREIGSKDAAADWALARLSAELCPVLARARHTYVGVEDERWDDLQPRVRPLVEGVMNDVGHLARNESSAGPSVDRDPAVE